MKFFNKKIFLSTTLCWSFFVMIMIFLTRSGACMTGTFCNTVSDTLQPLDFFIFIPVIFLPMAIVLFFLHIKVFEAWKKFAFWTLPIILVLTYFITRDTGGQNFFSMDYSIYFLAFIYGLFLLISLIIITVTALKHRSK